MRGYANAEEKQVALSLAVMEKWISEFVRESPKCIDKPAIKRRLQQMLKHIYAITAAAVSGLESEAINALERHICTQDVLVVPKDKVRNAPTYVVAEADDFALLVSRIDDCYTCLKTPAEVKGCKTRKAMLRCGAIPTGTRNECPFMP